MSKPTAGSGQIGVKTNSVDSALSGMNNLLTIRYSIRNKLKDVGLPAFRKIRYDLVDPTPTDLDTGFFFMVDTSISNNPMVYAVIQKVLHDWSCATGVNFKIKGDTTLQGIAADGVSLIYLDDYFHGQPLGRFGGSKPRTCTDVNTSDEIWFYTDIDLAMSRDLDSSAATGWFFDTTLTLDLPVDSHDFYAVALHELGHGHSLDHVNDVTDLMFSTVSSGFVSSLNRKNIIGSPNALDAGIDVMVKSSGLNLTGCTDATGMIPVILENCGGGGTNLSELFKSYGNIIVFPNPAGNDGFNVSYELIRNAYVKLRLFDYTGKEVLRINKGYNSVGEHTIHINTSDLSNGLYFFVTTINEKTQAFKVVKL